MADLEETIESASQNPAAASGDSGSVTAHNLKDLIEADKYLAAKAASKVAGFGVRFTKLKPPGAD